MATFMLSTETFSLARNAYVPCDHYAPTVARDREALITAAQERANGPLTWLETSNGHLVSSNVTIFGVDIHFRIRAVTYVGK